MATKQKVSLFIALLVVFATTPLMGQLPTGSIVGTVYDRTGATVPGAQLVLNDTATGNPRDTSTSPEGSYEFLELRPGTYDLAVEAKGTVSTNCGASEESPRASRILAIAKLIP